MSAWRAKALELFPSLRCEVEAAKTVGFLWIELVSRFQRCYDSEMAVAQNGSTELLRSICLYAIWCTRSDSFATQEAALIQFYEGIPRFAIQSESSRYKRIVADLIQNLGLAEIEKSAGTTAIALRSDELKKFLADARQAENERQKRLRKRS
jgi:hypothetical protein